MDEKLKDLPQDRASLEAIVRSLLLEREQQKQRAEAEILRQRKRADDLHLETYGCNSNYNDIGNGVTERERIG